jgi:hypothetical protein
VSAEADSDAALRDRAIKQLKKQHDFIGHLLVYVLVNAGLVLVWFATGQNGFFWPMFPMLFWGIGVVMNAWDVWRGDHFAEARIQRQMQRLSGDRR